MTYGHAFTSRWGSGTDRWGGVSGEPWAELNLGGHVGDDPQAVRANRVRAADRLGIDSSRVVWMHQVHGAEVAHVRTPADTGASVDALVTDVPELPLAVLVADCVPVLLADLTAGVVAAAHAGRPGLAAGVVPATCAAMRKLGADPARMVAHLGPSVGAANYEVPAAMREAVAAVAPASWARSAAGTPALDVAAGVVEQLHGLGVAEVHRSPIDTAASPDHFSYRRDGRTGRFAGYVWLNI